MGLITVEGIRVFAYHGHLPEEAVLGGHFIVNVWVTVDTSEVEKTDDLNDTVDYVKIIEVVREQMAIRANTHFGYDLKRFILKLFLYWFCCPPKLFKGYLYVQPAAIRV